MSFSEKKLKEEIAKRALGTPTDEFVFTVGARWGYSVGYADCAGFNRQAGRNEALNEVKARDAKLREILELFLKNGAFVLTVHQRNEIKKALLLVEGSCVGEGNGLPRPSKGLVAGSTPATQVKTSNKEEA